MSSYIGVSNVAREISTPYTGISNVARSVNTGFIGVNNIARQWYKYAPGDKRYLITSGSGSASAYGNGGYLYLGQSSGYSLLALKIPNLGLSYTVCSDIYYDDDDDKYTGYYGQLNKSITISTTSTIQIYSYGKWYNEPKRYMYFTGCICTYDYIQTLVSTPSTLSSFYSSGGPYYQNSTDLCRDLKSDGITAIGDNFRDITNWSSSTSSGSPNQWSNLGATVTNGVLYSGTYYSDNVTTYVGNFVDVLNSGNAYLLLFFSHRSTSQNSSDKAEAWISGVSINGISLG